MGKNHSSKGLMHFLKISNHNSSINCSFTHSRKETKQKPELEEKNEVIEEKDDEEEVCEDDLEVNDNIKIPLKINTPEEQNKIYQILVSNFLFEGLNDEIVRYVMNELIQLQIENGKFVYEKGFDKDFFFIIAKGKVNIKKQ